MLHRDHRRIGRGAFTLIELLAVLAITGVLAAIFIPTLGAARAAASRTKTKMLFSQWAVAIENFRQDYGCYPALGTGNLLSCVGDTLVFCRTLTGQNPDGIGVPTTAELNGNTRRIAFYALGSGEIVTDASDPNNGRLVDAFGNPDIAVMMDRNGDGLVRRDGSDGPLPGVGAGGWVPGATDFPDAGIHAGVVFYSAGRGRDASDMVLSWK